MNNLTTTLLTKNSRYDTDEAVKQGASTMFDSSSEQRISRYSLPSLILTITYKGLSNAEYQTLRAALESNYANTFILDLDSDMDLRPDLMTINASVWAFKDFSFTKYPASCINGQITLISSVLFNFTEYQDLMTESSTNTLNITTDTSFKTLLQTTSPRAVTYGYQNNSISSSIGISQRLNKDKGGLQRKYTLTWLTEETEFLALLQFYRKHSGIMGEFGMTDFDIDDTVLINSRFLENSMTYSKRLDGLYETELSIIEVK